MKLTRAPSPSEAIRTKLIATGVVGDDAYVVIAGPANTYGHYITTREEYSVQRYEGASTIYGPCKDFRCTYHRGHLTHVPHTDTLEAYIDLYSSLVPYLRPNVTDTPPSDPPPPEQTSKAITLRVRTPLQNFLVPTLMRELCFLQKGVMYDSTPRGKHFGDVLEDVNTTAPYTAGDTAAATFVGANPRVSLAALFIPFGRGSQAGAE